LSVSRLYESMGGIWSVGNDGDVGLPGENPGELNSTFVPCLNDTLCDVVNPNVAFPLKVNSQFEF
jgi:hypothetical protein